MTDIQENSPVIYRANFDLDYQELDRLLDRVKTRVFLGSNAAFLGPLMCSMNFVWSSDIKTACVNGVSIQWNPYWFLKLPEPTRLTVLLHELWHVALLHMLRRGVRDPEQWNWACDLAINNMLYHQGYSFDGTFPWLDDSIIAMHPKWAHASGHVSIGNYGEAPAEEIYELLGQLPDLSVMGVYVWGHEIQEDEAVPGEAGGDTSDLVEPESEAEKAAIEPTIVNRVVQASHAAKMAGSGDGTPSDVETMLKRFLQPKIPWETLLNQWMQDLLEEDYSLRRPNRRHQEMYLASLVEDDGRLVHLCYYLDVSGSVSDKDVVRFNSEVKYIKDYYNPQKVSIVLFDDVIQRVIVFEEEDPFEEIVITGRGGTNLEPVRKHIIKNKPTAAIIFTDLHVRPMDRLPADIDTDLLWVGVNASRSHIPVQGRLIHIRE